MFFFELKMKNITVLIKREFPGEILREKNSLKVFKEVFHWRDIFPIISIFLSMLRLKLTWLEGGKSTKDPPDKFLLGRTKLSHKDLDKQLRCHLANHYLLTGLLLSWKSIPAGDPVQILFYFKLSSISERPHAVFRPSSVLPTKTLVKLKTTCI